MTYVDECFKIVICKCKIRNENIFDFYGLLWTFICTDANIMNVKIPLSGRSVIKSKECLTSWVTSLLSGKITAIEKMDYTFVKCILCK